MGGRALAAALAGLLLAPGLSVAHDRASPPATAALAPSGCPGDPIETDRVITGSFPASLERSFVLVPFRVSAGTTAVRVKYCYDQPEQDTSGQFKHTLDLGLYQPRQRTDRPWGIPEFRGWGGSSHPDVTVSPEGFSSEAAYRANPKRHVAGKTTRAFRPGPIPAGDWAVELGLAAIASQAEGDDDGTVAWRLEIELSGDPAHADQPYRPAPYRSRPVRRTAGWYAGDFHVHAEHSALGDATMTETFDYAFRPRPRGGAGLDFITLSDYVSGSAWGEIGRYQGRYPGKLVVRSAEVITYRGHANNHASASVTDYREGRVYERRPDGALLLRRGPRAPSAIFDRVHERGGFTQINHPTIFPSSVPFFASLCRGCPWDYSDAETRYSKVDAIEIATGPSGLKGPLRPGPNPFTVTGIQFWEDALAEGHRIAAVGSSDSHNAGRTPNPVTQAPIGEATTVVYTDRLSENGVECGVRAGHTYVKVTGSDAPDLRLEARAPGSSGPPAIMGDTIRASQASFRARVLGGAPGADPQRPGTFQLAVWKNGAPIMTVPVTSGNFSLPFASTGPGRYRLQLQRGPTIEAVSSPIYLDPAAAANRRTCAPLRVEGVVRSSYVLRGRTFAVRCRASGNDLRACRVEVRLSPRRRSQTIGSGQVRMAGGTKPVTITLTPAGRRALARRGSQVTVVFSALDDEGSAAQDHRLTTLRRAGGGPGFTG